jgi:hypothetical protein
MSSYIDVTSPPRLATKPTQPATKNLLREIKFIFGEGKDKEFEFQLYKEYKVSN